jgi:hypothetical protein
MSKLSAAIEVRRLFPGITDNVRARELRPDHRRLARRRPSRVG